MVITGVKERGFKRYYDEGEEVDRKDKTILAIVRQKIPFTIVSLLLQYRVLQHKELVDKLDLLPSTVSYHLNKLIQRGVIEVSRYGEERGYSVANKKKLMRFLVRYEMHTAIDSFKDIWEDLF